MYGNNKIIYAVDEPCFNVPTTVIPGLLKVVPTTSAIATHETSARVNIRKA